MYVDSPGLPFAGDSIEQIGCRGSSVACLLSSSGQIYDSDTAWLCTFLASECTHERDAGIHMHLYMSIYVYEHMMLSLFFRRRQQMGLGTLYWKQKFKLFAN